MRKIITLCLIAFIFMYNPAKANETEPNNTPAQANTLALNGSNTGIINPGGDVDWWKVKTNSDGLLSVTLTPLSGRNTYVYLYDTAGVIQLTGTYSTATFTISQDGLAAGTYYMAVNCYYSTDTSSYIISNTLTPASVSNDIEPNNSRPTALTLPLNSSTNGHIGYYYNNHRDTTDWYKITTNTDGQLRLSLNPLNGTNVYVTLFDNDGTTVLQSTYSTGPFSISQDGLAAGTYYAAVYCYYNSQFSPYTLSDSLFPVTQQNDKEPNNSLPQANSLPLNATVTGHIGYYYNHYRDTTDWYKLTTNADGLLRLSLNPVNGTNVYVTLFDHDGTTVLKSQYSAGAFSTFTDGLAAGTYYVAVYCYYNSQFSPYTLSDSLFTTGIGNDKEPNNSLAQADSLPLNSTVTGHIGYYYNNYRDTTDWYKLTTNADGLLRLSLNPTNGTNVYVTLFDKNGTTVLNSQYSTQTFSTFTDGLAAGTYYLAVYCYYSSQFAPYTLSDSLFTYNKNDIEPNAYFSQATTISANRTVTGHVGFYYNGVRDTVDTWKINYTGTSGNLNMTFNLLPPLTATNNNTYFQVYRDTTAAPIYSNYFTAPSTAINLTGLAQGYYYIKVFEYYSSQFETYSITDSFPQVNIAQISINTSETSLSGTTCSTDSITYNLSGSHSPYMVRLYKNSALYDSSITTGSTVTFKSLSAGNYYATVYGDGATDSAYSKSTISTVLPPVPTIVNNSNIGVHTATLSWTKLSCVNYYQVQYRAVGNQTWTVVNTTGDTANLALTGLQPYTSYVWEAASVDTVNGLTFTSTYSDSLRFTTLSDTAHIALIFQGAGSGCNNDTLKYMCTNSAAPYTVTLYRNGLAYGSPLSVTDTASFYNVPPGNYVATATGTGSGGSLGTSSTAQLTPPVTTGLNAAAVSPSQEKLNWNAINCVSYYSVQYRPKGSVTWTTVNTANDSTTLSNLLASTMYIWQVASVDSSNRQSIMSAYSSADSFMTANPLPVTFINFDGVLRNDAALLNWSTATEINNKGFEVQRSNGQNFTDIGFVAGQGNSFNVNHYSYTDDKIISGSNYYRLKQIDLDGRLKYSSVIRLDFTKFGWTVLGNPANNNSWVQLQLDKTANVTLQLFSINGNIVQTINKGILVAGTYSIPLNFGNAASGMYVVRLETNHQAQSKKVVK